VLRPGEVYTEDFAFVILDHEPSLWERLKIRFLLRTGRLRPPNQVDLGDRED
jgi:hypothetical protein